MQETTPFYKLSYDMKIIFFLPFSSSPLLLHLLHLLLYLYLHNIPRLDLNLSWKLYFMLCVLAHTTKWLSFHSSFIHKPFLKPQSKPHERATYLKLVRKSIKAISQFMWDSPAFTPYNVVVVLRSTQLLFLFTVDIDISHKDVNSKLTFQG